MFFLHFEIMLNQVTTKVNAIFFVAVYERKLTYLYGAWKCIQVNILILNVSILMAFSAI